MELAEIASVSGKGGLFKVLKASKSGLIMESLDEARTKLVASASSKVSVLNEISIYTHTREGTTPLEDVLRMIHKEYGADLGLDADADGAELKSFLKSVLPDYDDTRVYVSDIKKLVKWYDVILKFAPEILTVSIPEAGKSTGSEEKDTEA